MADYTTQIDTKQHIVALERAIGAKRGEIVGKLLLALSKKHPLANVRDMAEILGVSYQTIYNWIQDYNNYLNEEKGVSNN